MHQPNIVSRIRKLFSQEKQTTENCVICGIDTGVPQDLIIDMRFHYVEGSGQLCKECWEDIYKNVH